MTWSATKTSNSDGNWATGAIWTPSGEPDIDDYVEVRHNITVAADGEFAGLYLYNGGTITWNSGWTLTRKDAAGTHELGEHILIDDGASGWAFTATGNGLGCRILSPSANPTYRLKMRMEAKSGAETRTLQFDMFRFQHIAPILSDGTTHIFFNTGDPLNDPSLFMPAPKHRDQRFASTFIDGRAYGRVYRLGGNAGTVRLTGIAPWSSFTHQKLATLRDSGNRCSFFGEYVSMPSCWIEDYSPGVRDGIYFPFSLTLIEDLV